METTFGRTVETRRLKSNHNRSNCSLANIDVLTRNSEKFNQFLNNIISDNKYNNSNHNSNTDMYDSIQQFDSQLERINNELARAQLMNQLGTSLKKTSSGYLSDSECYSTRLPARLRIANETGFFDRNNNNQNQFQLANNDANMKSCTNMQTAFNENNEFLLQNNRLHRSNLCLKLNRFNNIINNNSLQIKQQQHQLQKQQQQQNANTLKQKKNDYYYNLIRTNQYKLNKNNDFVNNRSFRTSNHTSNINNQAWVIINFIFCQ